MSASIRQVWQCCCTDGACEWLFVVKGILQRAAHETRLAMQKHTENLPLLLRAVQGAGCCAVAVTCRTPAHAQAGCIMH